MFTLVESNKITVYLGPHTQPPNMPTNAANIAFVQEYVANLLKTAFPHLTDNQVRHYFHFNKTCQNHRGAEKIQYNLTFQIKITVQGLFNFDEDIPQFKEHLRDFLVQVTTNLLSSIESFCDWYIISFQIREFTGEDDSDLFLEERESALKKAQEDKKRYQMTVPGMLNPHEVPEEMQEEM